MLAEYRGKLTFLPYYTRLKIEKLDADKNQYVQTIFTKKPHTPLSGLW